MNRPDTFDFEALKRADRALAYLELEKDPVFSHLSGAQRFHYLDFALNAGRAQAELYRGRDAFDLAKEFGIKVVIQQGSNLVAGVTLRAVYDARASSIELFQASLIQVQQETAHWLPFSWTYQQIAALHLAHELFHHLEATQIEPIDRQLPPITTLRLGKFAVTKSHARQCREIAAHAFAKTLTDFPFLPNVLDAISQQPSTLSQFQSALERARLATAGSHHLALCDGIH